MRKKTVFAVTALLTMALLAGCGEPAGSESAAASGSAGFTSSPAPESRAAAGAGKETSSPQSSKPANLPGGPFDPWVPLELPPGPYLPAEDAEALYGDWHHYADPEGATVTDPTYLLRLELEALVLGYGTYATNAGVFFRGACQYGAGGLLTAELYGYDEDREPKTLPVSLTLMLEQGEGEEDTLVVTVKDLASQDPDFETFFGALVEAPTPFARYEG